MSVLDRHQKAVDAFNAHDPDAVVRLYARNAVVYDPQHTDEIRGRDAIRADYASMMQSFPDIMVEIRSRHVDGRRMMYELRLTGTHDGPLATPDGDVPATGRRIDVPGAVFADLNDADEFVNVRRYYDLASMLRQLGFLDEAAASDRR